MAAASFPRPAPREEDCTVHQELSMNRMAHEARAAKPGVARSSRLFLKTALTVGLLAAAWGCSQSPAVPALQPGPSPVESVAFSPNGKVLGVAANVAAKLWDVDSGKELLTLKGHKGNITVIAFSPDNKKVATGGSDGTGKLWDLETGKELVTLTGHTGALFALAISPDGKFI